jgi:hypothetical protein
VSDIISHVVEIRFRRGARRHGVSRTSVRYVMATTTGPERHTTRHGTPGWLYTGRDEGGREVEVIAVEVRGTAERAPQLLVIHAMPTSLNKGRTRKRRGRR